MMNILNKSSLLGLFIVMISQPVSADVLDAIGALNQAKADWFVNRIDEKAGYTIKTLSFENEGYHVAFQYQRWKVINKSVCADHQGNLLEYSKCTQAAKHGFKELCETWGDDLSGWKVEKAKSMFCKASIDFKPTYAVIEPAGSKGQKSGTQISEACRQAKLDAYMNPSSENARRRDEVCY